MRFRGSFMAIALACGLAAFSARAQEKQPAPKKERVVRVTADVLSHNDATGVGAGKNFTIVDGETLVKGDDGKWNQKQKVAEATGNLSMVDPQASGTSKKVIVQYAASKKIVEMVDDVTITVKPRKKAASGPAPVSLEGDSARVKNGEEDSPRSHPAIITCDRVEYHYARDKKYAKLTGNFKVVQKLKDLTRNVTAKYAEWFGNEDKILLYPPVHFEDTKGQKFDTPQPVTLFTTEGAETIQAKDVVLEFPVEDEEDEKPAPKPNQKKP